ncbi:hypothetical protein POWCR01_000085700 [Plasmodium ovale]|uniref:PIR protein n=1 Tax=Plasmodium ovale TaxID=36330 RepID=A0A1C3KHA7_PLAOA|nr:hypothetical protein POWCR01_000085700 [Plasmodium ovale]
MEDKYKYYQELEIFKNKFISIKELLNRKISNVKDMICIKKYKENFYESNKEKGVSSSFKSSARLLHVEDSKVSRNNFFSIVAIFSAII